MADASLYISGENHNSKSAKQYASTSGMPHRFLAYRDFPSLVSPFNIKTALDFGSGTGASVQYLLDQGYQVTGVDKSISMIEQAKTNCPEVSFFELDELENLPAFDLVFSSFVLFELPSRQEIIEYLNLAADNLKEGGIFCGITGSEHLHCCDRKWINFNVSHEDNYDLYSGKSVKLQLKENSLLFRDYFWKEEDYRSCFSASNLDLIAIHYPIASESESFAWEDELFIPPFVVFLAKRKN